MPGTILSVNNYYYPRGGAEVVFFRHNGRLEEAGWSVVPFAMQHEKNHPSPWSEHFVEEIEFGSETDTAIDRIKKGLKAVYSLEARTKIERVIDQASPDLCHAHNIYHHLSPSILGAVRQRGIPIVMTLHDLKIACPAYSMLTHDGVCERCRGGRLFQVAAQRCMKGSVGLSTLVMIESYLHRFLGSYLKNVERFIVPSRFYFNKLVDWGFDASRFDYVPNFVDVGAFEPAFTPGRRFVYFGRLSREKGIATLIEAAAIADVGVDIVGTGPMEGELRALAAERGADVRFHGFLYGDALTAAVAAARAIVLPSEWYENAPLSVLEACAMGKPVIAADIGGLPELLVDGESGWIFESGSVESLAEQLEEVAALPEHVVETAGIAARERMAADFSPDRYIADLRAIYASLGVPWH